MAVNPSPKRRSERFNRRKSTLVNKADELVEFCDVDVALTIRNRKTGKCNGSTKFSPRERQIAEVS
jgi:hypothetical protein